MHLPKEIHNQLIYEKSPYLLQHADNPVDWYAWNEQAFEKARLENKPVFLSIGYSTCHWCHVMAHESFENEAIARMINEYFVPIKVDREERPDIDNIYMAAVQSMTGQGGWPLTVFLTPDKKPFYGGTYFPPKAKWGTPGITDIMQSIHQTWINDPKKVEDSSRQITEALRIQNVHKSQDVKLSVGIFEKSFQQFSQNFDSVFGGFGHAPKFPSAHNLSFLLRYWKRTKSKDALNMVETTLEKMARGGMYDHLGGGFHRYSVDPYWQIPHFEKMLYDQAILARTYLEAYQITKNEFYAHVARETLDYVLRDMQHLGGGFYSAEDADSYDPDQYASASIEERAHLEKTEGAFYLFRFMETKDVLGEEAALIFDFYYNIEKDGNALQDPHGEFVGKNVVFVKHSIDEVAENFKITVDAARRSLEASKAKMLEYRNKRPRPHLDDKIITDWNGLMISTLALASRILNEDRYKQAAIRAVDFISDKLILENGQLLHRYRDNNSAIDGSVEDYAFLVHGLFGLYEATFEIRYLELSYQLTNKMIDLFWDQKQGGFFFTADNAEKLLFRQKEIYDGAIPSGNSIAALILLKFYYISQDQSFEQKAEQLFSNFAHRMNEYPSAYSQALIAFDYAVGPSLQIVIATKNNQKSVNDMVNVINEKFIPNTVILMHNQESLSEDIVRVAPFIKNQRMIEDKTTVYVCENHKCQLPVIDLEALKNLCNKL